MSLTRQQKWRIEKIQTERIHRAQKASNKAQHSPNEAQTGLVLTRYGQRLLVESPSGTLYQCTGRRHIELSVAGDRVIFQPISDTEGVVSALLERENQLRHAHKVIAANIHQLWLVVAIWPHYDFALIDRYLIKAENAHLPIHILVNKSDLAHHLDKVKTDFFRYESMGYEVYYVSVKTQTNLALLKKQLNHKTQLFLGQSGVGKSSLINALIPELDLRVNEISNKTKLGKHTTTHTSLYHIPSGGDLIDSPGIRQFQLDTLTHLEILNGFREFKPFIGRCKFRNCQHINEPNCEVKNALNSGDIHPKRYQNYLTLIQSLKKTHAPSP